MKIILLCTLLLSGCATVVGATVGGVVGGAAGAVVDITVGTVKAVGSIVTD